jgi:T6SS, Transcription factor, DNA binding domain
MLSRIDGYARSIGLLSRFDGPHRNLGRFMPQPPFDPPVADTAPDAETLTRYDEEHLVTYLRLLDAEADGADWTEATRLVLHIDASREPARARRAWESHLARAKWMTEHGYQHLLRGRAPG